MELITHEILPETEFNVEENGDLTWWQKIATNQEVDLSRLRPRAHRLVNHNLLWRHWHPYKQECRDGEKRCDIYGHIDAIRMAEDSLYAKLRIENFGESHRALMDIVRNPKANGFDQIGVSIAAIDYEDGRIYGEEVSITPFPNCKTCLTPSIDNKEILDKIGENELTDENTAEVIKKLTEERDAYGSTIKEMEDEVQKRDAKLKELEDQIVAYRNEVDSTIKEMEDTIKAQKDKITYLEEKAPLIAKIPHNEDEVNDLKALSVDTLKFMVKKFEIKEKVTPAITQPLDNVALENEGKSKAEDLKKKFPELYKKLEREAKDAGKDLEEIIK